MILTILFINRLGLAKMTFVAIGCLLVATLVIWLYEQWYLKTYHYDLTDEYIIIKKGPIAPQEITIPYERIQDVYLDQDLLDRVFGMYDLHLSTATISS